ncbi:alpha/beta hydrolase [Pendulispora brunnea]|uniref:Alpha/beta hydrolase n=1 Tax=Pendulispora brunnea TaxID=2905690 RepID=A0ABZ2KAY0_9BACT
MKLRRVRTSSFLLVIGAIFFQGCAGQEPAPIGDAPSSLSSDACTASRDGGIDRLSLKSGAKLPYYHTHSLDGSTQATQAVLVIHGTGRNARGYFDSMVTAAEHAGAAENTIILAPWFQTDEDDPARGDAYWTNGGDSSWKDGGGAVSPRGVSSFEAVDEMLHALGDKSRFPNLTRISMVGHSAGGQFVQRYAAGGRAPEEIEGVTFKFVPANPSSYLYLSRERPRSTGSCEGYNDYKYGLDHRNAYMGALTEQQIRDRYTKRRVSYLLGTKDVNQDHSIDTDCSAKVQGKNRFERGKAYYAAIKKDYPSAPHDRVDVPGIGHDNDAMFDSTEGRNAIFGP